MNPERLQHKVGETRAIADQLGVDLAEAPLLVTFEMPLWNAAVATREITELARHPGTAVAVSSPDPLPELRRAVSAHPYMHVIAEQGLTLGLSGGATISVYESLPHERQAFAVALIAGVASEQVRIALAPFASSGRQVVYFEQAPDPQSLTGRELLHAIQHAGGTVAFAGEDDTAVVVDDLPVELETVCRALASSLAGQAVRILRMPSGRFRITPDPVGRPLPAEDRDRFHALAQGIAVSCDRFIEARGGPIFGFVTEPVARWKYGTERGARALSDELFGRPDTALTHLGLHPFRGEGSVFFAYEGSETVWEAANKGIPCIPVRDIAEYGRIVHALRRGDA